MRQERKMLDEALKSNGYAGLDDAKNLLSQIAINIEDHDDFRMLLNSVEPKERRNAYDAIAPRLRFRALALEDYLMQSRLWSSEMATKGGEIKPYELKLAEDAIKADLEAQEMKGTMRLECVKCTAEAVFPGKSQADALTKAREAGWVYDALREKEICPNCPTSFRKVN